MTAARVHLMSPDKLSNDLIGMWRSHQTADENLRGPFFSPEYIRVAASARPEVTVAVIETPGQAPAFLPFHRDASNVARPVGLRASDFSGIIAPPGYTWSPEAVIRSCGLAGWDFTNIVTSDQTMDPYFRVFADSPFVDLSEGFDGFARDRAQAGSDLVKSVAQKGQEDGARGRADAIRGARCSIVRRSHCSSSGRPRSVHAPAPSTCSARHGCGRWSNG